MILFVAGFIIGYTTALLVVHSLRPRLYRHRDRRDLW